MDTITHALVGTTIGQAYFRKKLGNKAPWIGAIASVLPDLDVFYSSGPMSIFKYHRGYSHALPIHIIFALGVGLILWALWSQKKHPKIVPIITLIGLSLAAHGLLDVLTSYGTQLFLPFTSERFAGDVIAIIDVFYSGILIVGLLLINVPRLTIQGPKYALGLSCTYLLFCYVSNENLKDMIRKELISQNDQVGRLESYPTLFQPFVKQVVAEVDQQIYVGFTSILDPLPIQWTVTEDALSPEVADLRSTKLGEIFDWFSGSQNCAEVIEKNDQQLTVRITDFRYINPKTPTQGMWGIEADYTDGERVGDVRYYRQRQSWKELGFAGSWQQLSDAWQFFWHKAFAPAPVILSPKSS